MKKITTIIFDWAGVFCTPGELYSHPRLLSSLNCTPADIETRVRHVQDEYYRGNITQRDVWRHIFKLYDLTGFTFKELNAAYLASYRPYPEILAIPEKLKKRYTVALLSNLTEDMMKHIMKTHELRPKFHQLFFSNREGYLKPEPELFNLALKKLHATPQETLFIDDTKKNLVAAKTLGMHTLHATTPKKLIADLRKRGIL